jgi:hypothetical protein
MCDLEDAARTNPALRDALEWLTDSEERYRFAFEWFGHLQHPQPTERTPQGSPPATSPDWPGGKLPTWDEIETGFGSTGALTESRGRHGDLFPFETWERLDEHLAAQDESGDSTRENISLEVRTRGAHEARESGHLSHAAAVTRRPTAWRSVGERRLAISTPLGPERCRAARPLWVVSRAGLLPPNGPQRGGETTVGPAPLLLFRPKRKPVMGTCRPRTRVGASAGSGSGGAGDPCCVRPEPSRSVV